MRHLLAALFTDRRPLSAFEIVRRAGRTPEGILAGLRGWLAGRPDGADDLARWDRIRDELRIDILAGYDNDEASGDDRLQNSARSQRAGDSWFCGRQGRVVQIDFNAWHYMDADLWSSLAARVFDALSREFHEEFAAACVEGLESLHDQQRALQAERDRLLGWQGELDAELARQAGRRAARKLELDDYLEGIRTQAAREIAGRPEVAQIAEELHLREGLSRAELERARGELESVVGRVRQWRRSSSPKRVLLLTALAIGILFLAPLLATLYARLAVVAIAALGAWSAVMSWSRAALKKVGAALAAVDEIEAAARARKGEEERRFEEDRDRIAARIAEVEREQHDLARRRRELEAQLASLGDERTLADFVRERAASDDYRKKLGVISAVHQDFQQLATFLAPGARGPDVERILLYIDDLDRCSPGRVVEVLQAVHVILSLPLFVVVVAVDSRWLLDSLTAYYRQQFPADPSMADAARPHQYLEKIFQIPFTLTPMSPGGYSSLVGSLLRPHIAAADADEPARQGAAGEGRGLVPLIPPRGAASRRVDGEPTRGPRVNLTPRSLRLEQGELETMARLAGLIPSPRGAKRLVNLYRIVRASLDDEALDRLVGGGYRILQLCLALVVGHPAVAAELFEAILSHRVTSPKDVGTWCREHEAGRRPASSTVGKETAALRELSGWNAAFADWDAVRDAVRRAARFSLETGRVLGHFQERPAEDPATL